MNIDNKHVLILGAPKSGKTILLKEIALPSARVK